MILTVADVIAELQRYPASMPVWIECCKVYYEDECGCGPDEREFSEATDVRFNGSHVLIGCDD